METIKQITYNLPLWTVNPKEYLQKRLEDLGRVAYRRGYQQICYTDENKLFHSADKVLIDNLTPKQCSTEVIALQKDSNRIIIATGVDLSNDKRPGNAIVTIAFDRRDRIKYVLDVECGAWTSPQMAKILNRHAVRNGSEFVIVENNGYQGSLREWIKADQKEEYYIQDKLKSLFTHNQKMDEAVGLPSMEVEFDNESWVIPVGHIKRHKLSCMCGWCSLKEALTLYPHVQEYDTLMAMWMAYHHIKKGVLNSLQIDVIRKKLKGE